MEYTDYDLGIKILFKSNDMDLREVGIVSTALHRAFNDGFAQGLELPVLLGRRRYYYHEDDPLLISLTVTSLEYGSLSLRTRARIHKALRDLSIGAAGSLIASTIWAIGASAGPSTTVALPERPEVNHRIDLGPNIAQMVESLSATGKAWELTIEDERTGVRVTIQSQD